MSSDEVAARDPLGRGGRGLDEHERVVALEHVAFSASRSCSSPSRTPSAPFPSTHTVPLDPPEFKSRSMAAVEHSPLATTNPPQAHELEQHRGELTGVLLPHARLAVRGRGRRAGDAAPRLARASTASRAARRCARGSTGSRRTSASTCSTGRERRARPMDLGPAREPIVENLNTLPEVTWIEPIPDGSSSRQRRSGRGRRRARDDPARVRRRAPAPAAAPARGADPLRGAALAGDRGRGAARDERRLGQQRAAARPRDARRRPTSSAADASPPLDEADRELLARYVEAFERYDIDALTSLIQEDATQSMPPFDLWLRGRDDIFTWWFGPGHRLPGLARHPDRRGERLAGVRPVQAEPDRRRLRAVGAAGARARRRPDRRVHVLPRHRRALPALRAAAPARRVARRAGRRSATSSRSSLDAWRSRSSRPSAPRARAGAARARRPSPTSGASALTSQTIVLGRTRRHLRTETGSTRRNSSARGR